MYIYSKSINDTIYLSKSYNYTKKRYIYSFMNRHKIPIYVSLRNTKKENITQSNSNFMNTLRNYE